MKKPILIICVLLFAVHDFHPQQDGFPKLTGPYLGQKQPGLTPEPFAEDITEVHTVLHSGIVFSPDGTEAYWKPYRIPSPPILMSRVSNGTWTKPQAAPFSKAGQGDDSPFLSPDGKRLFFLSQRPEKGKESIWVMERTPEGWSDPARLPDIINSMALIHWQFSVDLEENLYFGAMVRYGREGYIYCSKFEDGQYTTPQRLGSEVNLQGEYNYSPYIFPDGNTLLFTRNQKPARIFASFRKKDGGWTEAEDLGRFLPEKSCLNPIVTADGKYLFFLAEGKPCWISTRIIEARTKLNPSDRDN